MIDWRTRPALASALPAAQVSLGRPPGGLLADLLVPPLGGQLTLPDER